MPTYYGKLADHSKSWISVDAEGLVVGRLAAIIATRLRGKHLPHFTPHADLGDYIVVTNADKIALTGKKLSDKVYYRHTGYPGGIRSRTASDILEGKRPEELLRLAVERMMPGGRLSRQQLKHLKIYCGSEHPHTAQNPTPLNVSELNPKNTLRASH